MKIGIIGGGHLGRTVTSILTEKGIESEIITLEDVNHKVETNSAFTPESIPLTLTGIMPDIYTPPPTRAERRKKKPKKQNRRF